MPRGTGSRHCMARPGRTSLCRDRRGRQEPSAPEGAARPIRAAASHRAFWFNNRRRVERCLPYQRGRHGRRRGRHPDVGGSRASMAMMAAEILGIPVERVRPIVADTSSIGFSFLTGGSRVTFATGMATTQAAEKVVEELKKRAADDLDITPDAVEWKDGKAFPLVLTPAASSRCPWPKSRSNRDGPAGDQCRGVDQRAGCRPRFCDAYLRCRGRQGNRLRQNPALYGRAGCRPRDPPLLCRGPDPGGVTQGIGWP